MRQEFFHAFFMIERILRHQAFGRHLQSRRLNGVNNTISKRDASWLLALRLRGRQKWRFLRRTMIRHAPGYELSVDHRNTQYDGDECHQQQKPGYPHYPRLSASPAFELYQLCGTNSVRAAFDQIGRKFSQCGPFPRGNPEVRARVMAAGRPARHRRRKTLQ